jgi:aminoglycoside phosphotransferase family enzyme
MSVENHQRQRLAAVETSLADKTKFLMQGDAYQPPVSTVIRHETHMSQVFLAGDRVYKA